MEYSFDKIIVYYKNNKMHHAKIKYKKIYSPGRIVDLEKDVYPDEFNSELKNIIHYYNSRGNDSFNVESLIEYSDYNKITQSKRFNNKVLSHIDSINNREYDMLKRVRKKLEYKNIKIKKISAVSLSLLLMVSGIGYSLSRAKPKENSMEKYYKSVIYINDNYDIALSDLDSIINVIDSLNENDNSLYKKLNICKTIINSNKPDNYFYQMIINKFLDLGGLSNINIMTNNDLKHLCMYCANLIMGGDNYGNLYANSDIIVMNRDTNKDKDYYKYLSYVADRYNISPERAEYSAVYAESKGYEKLPLIIKYIIITQTENAIIKNKFDFDDKKIMPTWWVGLKDKYDSDKLLREIRIKKEEIKEKIYNKLTSNEIIDNKEEKGLLK